MEMVEEGQYRHKIGPKRMKFKEIEENGEVDRVSALPDFLIVEILSRLPRTEDAIVTCILSKRWKYLWTSIPTLIFADRCYFYSSPRSDFFTFVDKTLTQRPQSKLKKFEMQTSYHIQYESQVNNWIRYAIGCNVEELILKLDSAWGTVCQLDQIFCTSSCFTDLTLQGCILNPTGAISWKNLRSLSISSGKLDEAVIENILVGSPLLETLVLNNCFGFRRLYISSESVKNLVLNRFIDSSQYDTLEIKAPKLLSLTIKGCLWLRKILLVNMSSLVEANLDYCKEGYEEIPLKEAEEEMLKGIILHLRHVKKLKIGGSCSKVLSRLEAKGFKFPSNMKLL